MNVFEVFVAEVKVPLVEAVPGVKLVDPLHKSFAGAGAGILNEFELPEAVNPELVKLSVALFTAAVLVAVKPANVTTPLEAATPVVPPNVQVPASLLAAVTDALLVVTVFPY